jgi:TolB protein
MNGKTLTHCGIAALLLASAGLLPLPGTLDAQQPPAVPAPPEATAPAQPDQVTLEMRRGQRPKMRLAIPAFRPVSLPPQAAGPARENEQVVRADLEQSGYFEIQGPEAFGSLRLTGNPPDDIPVYRSLGNEVLILADEKVEGDRLVLEGRVFDLGSGQAILAKRYRGPFSSTRRMAHTFADDVIRYLTSKPGIGLTSIAFTSDRTGHKEIYAMDYDGANPRRVTGHQSTSMSPAWSPDGNSLAYMSFFRGSPGIYIAEIASGRKRTVVDSGSLNSSPSFSPDGGKIVFARSVDGNVEIFTTDANGGGLRRLTVSGAIDTNPAWSPKGGTIAFTSSRAGNPHVYLMDSEGANQRRLSLEGEYNDGASWSPDGDLIAYTSRRGGRFQIAVTNVVTLETRLLTSGGSENESPSFSPDGRKIVFSSNRSGRKQLYVVDLDGGNLKQLTNDGNNDLPDWSRLPPAQ